MAKIGIQIMVLKDEVDTLGAYEVFRRLKEIGCNCVEMSQVTMNEENVAEIKRACKDFDMEICAISATVQDESSIYAESIVAGYDKIVADARELGVDYIRLGSMPGGYEGSYGEIAKFAHKAEAYADRLEKDGFKLYFHNHHREFTKYDNMYVMDIIKKEAPKLGFEIDIFWVQRGGENPLEFIKGYKNRLDLLHIKDYKIADPSTEVVDEEYRKALPELFADVVRFAEIGEGNLPIKDIIDVAVNELGTKYLIIEQDRTYSKDKFECYKLSIENLKKMGYGHML